jgi:hypothetical protein
MGSDGQAVYARRDRAQGCDTFRRTMDYRKLRDMVSHRVTFEFDSGAKIVGYVGSCMPPSGPVQMLVLSKVQILDGSDAVLAKYDELPLVPNNLIGFKITEGPL